MTAEIQDTPSALDVTLKAGATLRLPNTPSNRKVVAVILRLVADETGRPLYSFEEMRALLGYPDRRNTHNFWREFPQLPHRLPSHALSRPDSPLDLSLLGHRPYALIPFRMCAGSVGGLAISRGLESSPRMGG